MTNSRTVYAVSQGSYSDYRVCGLFESEDDAKAWVAAAPQEEFDKPFIEKFELFPAGTAPFRVRRCGQRIQLWWDGSHEAGHIDDLEELLIFSYYRRPPSRPTVRIVRAPYLNGLGLAMDVVADAPEKVRKAVEDRTRWWKSLLEPERRAFRGHEAREEPHN